MITDRMSVKHKYSIIVPYEQGTWLSILDLHGPGPENFNNMGRSASFSYGMGLGMGQWGSAPSPDLFNYWVTKCIFWCILN